MKLQPIAEMTDRDVAIELLSQTLRNQVRAIMYHSAGRTEQALAQRNAVSTIAIRRMEMEDAQRIIDLVATETRSRVLHEFRAWLGSASAVTPVVTENGNSWVVVDAERLRATLNRICPE